MVIDRLKAVIVRDLGVDESEIKPETMLNSLVTDSLEMANLMLEIEDEFKIAVEGFHYGITVQDAVRFVEAATVAQAGTVSAPESPALVPSVPDSTR